MKMKQSKGLKRNTIDKYYTKKCVVDDCIGYIKEHIDINEDDLIIEPSAGNGSFIEGIKSLSKNYRFFDIEPENDEIIKQNFLEYVWESRKTHVIGNPPFGRQSSTAIQFIKNACSFASSISFILPKSFKKDRMKKSFPLNFHLVYEIDLPENSFLVDGVEHNVETIFQIWEKRDWKRAIVESAEPENFVFVGKMDNPEISFRRVGVKAGAISASILDKSIESHYFIKFTNGKSVKDNIDLLRNIEFHHNNTVGPKSISKPELIVEFNRALC
jgi:predicted RNA methylase